MIKTKLSKMENVLNNYSVLHSGYSYDIIEILVMLEGSIFN